MPLVTDSLTLAPSEVNANIELYMQIGFWDLTTLLSLLIKRTSSSCDVAGRLSNITLPFSQYRKLWVVVARFWQSFFDPHFGIAFTDCVHFSTIPCPRADVFLSPNNCNASLPKKGHARATTCYTVYRSQRRWLFCSYGVSDGLANSIRCLAHRSLCRQLQRSCADYDVSWLNSTITLICGTGFSKS